MVWAKLSLFEYLDPPGISVKKPEWTALRH